MIDHEQSPFGKYSLEYVKWFDDHPFAFQSEFNAIRKFIPAEGTGIEIVAGTGRFAHVLHIPIGVEPSKSMASIARSIRIKVIKAFAE